ncbi:MAG TPA: hypothetical protein VLM38_22590, partial [Blastocatellia bacterium]|nr:hypothetical protein [Blastocatellia bacterium]
VIRRRAMERFMKRHQDRIIGTITGFDRVLFGGTLRSISYVEGLEIFLTIQRVLFKDFGQFVEKLSSRIKAHSESYAMNHKRPYRYIESSKLSKEEIAREIMDRDQITRGLVCVLTCIEPCQTFSIRRDRPTKKLALERKQRKCLHIYFYYVDRDFGLMHVRLQTWLPFTIQVCINGREWLARQMDRAGISYTKRDNTFTYIEDVAAAQRLMDQLTERKWEGFLNSFARRLNPIIKPEEGFNLRGYYWSIRQGEYATDVMFKDEQSLAQLYPALTRHAIERFSSRDVLRFLGRRDCDGFKREVTTKLQKRVEGVRIKHWVDENSIKMYDKQGSVLRIETTINNARRFKVRRPTQRNGKTTMALFPLRKGIADLKRRVEVSRSANGRYLEALAVVGETTPSHRLLDPVSQRLVKDGRSYRALHPISQADSRVFELLLKGENLIQGIRNRDLRTELFPAAELDPATRRKASARISRLIRLLRAHGLIYKVSKTNYHRITKKGHEVMATATTFRDSDVALLAAE